MMEKEKTEDHQENEKQSVSKHIGVKAIICILLAVIVSYIGISIFFMNHYFYNTIIDNVDCGLKTQSQARALLEEKANQYQLTIIGRDGITDTIHSDEIDLAFTPDHDFYEIKSGQNGFLWGLSFGDNHKYELSKAVTFDKDKLDETISKSQIFAPKNQKVPKNAYISDYSSDSNSYEIIAEDIGATVIREKAVADIQDAVEKFSNTVNLDEKGDYKNPEILSNDTRIVVQQRIANRYVQAKITYDWNLETEIVDGTVISQWLVLDENTANIDIDRDLVFEWVAAKAKEHDTYGTIRTFTTYDGTQKELHSGDYGWKTNKTAETDAIIKVIKTGQTIEKEPEYTQVAAVKGMKDIGNSYVEINLSAQHLYLWIEGEVTFESDFVSGKITNGNGTPAGVFGITYKQKEAVLRGENYETPVHYWMPFNRNVGMHDATWRKSFGGDIYINNGSHGCINLPYNAAKTIYDYMEKGFPVICYY